MDGPGRCTHSYGSGAPGGSTSTHGISCASLRWADGNGKNRQVRVCGRIANRQVSDQFCKPICKPDAAGQAETGETQKAGDDLAPYVCRGQYGDLRLPGTAETDVVWLITQRS
jgi:hypothetical protein